MARRPRKLLQGLARGSSRTPRRSRSRSSSTTRPSASSSRTGKLTRHGVRALEWPRTPKGDGRRRRPVDTVFLPADDVILAIGQENAFPWIERDIGIEFDKWDMPVVDKTTFQSTRPGVFFGGDAAWGPKNIIWAVDARPRGGHLDPQPLPGRRRSTERPAAGHEPGHARRWACTSGATATTTTRRKRSQDEARRSGRALREAQHRGRARASPPSRPRARCERCLNCDMQTVFTDKLCIECDACIDVCPVHCLTITPERRGAGRCASA